MVVFDAQTIAALVVGPLFISFLIGLYVYVVITRPPQNKPDPHVEQGST